MHDIRAIRETPETYAKAWSRRPSLDGKAVVAEILALDAEVRKHLLAKEAAEASRNAKSKEIGKAKASKDEALAASLMAEVASAKATIEEAGKLEAEAVSRRDDMLARLPNLPFDDVPDGADEHGNIVKRVWDGTQREEGYKPSGLKSGAKINQPKDHADLGEALKMMDFEAAARMSGARFVVLKGQLARLERALTQFMLDIQTGENGYSETAVPLLVRDSALFGTGQLPKFREDQFKASLVQETKFAELYDLFGSRGLLDPTIEDAIDEQVFQIRMGTLTTDPEVRRLALETFSELQESKRRRMAAEVMVKAINRGFLTDNFWLIPTAEVSLTNIIREQITDAADLPMRMTAATPCFRSEAGSAGRDTKGMIRMHQFIKVELVSITKPEDSAAEHERMTRCAEGILERLELPYRTMMLCAGDMGFGARKTYDLEVWLPSQNTYREISSCSNCGDFQARRMDARYREAPSGDNPKPKPEFVHTLNGSGLAVGRTLVAVLENYQEADGRIRVPKALVPYMGGLEVIGLVFFLLRAKRGGGGSARSDETEGATFLPRRLPPPSR
jgi:seryl-tRNA synthetase